METLVSNLIRSLASFNKEESTTRLPDLRRKIRRLQRTLELISAILPDAERRRMLEETIKQWSKELKEIIYDAEDLIDRYTLELPRLPEQQAPVRRYQFRLFTCFTGVASHEVGIGIEEINNRLKKIAKDGAIYQLQPSDVVSEEIVSHPRKSPIVPEVGIEEEARALARLLLNPLKPGNQVLAITGMGGIGKTTLAEKIYNTPEIKQHFHMRIWVLVSQHYKDADLLRRIISSAAYSAEVGATRQKLQQILSGVIEGRRFLIVLDDVWSADVWENVLQDPLQSGAPGSRVLITTRNEDIAKQMGVVMIHNVRPLGVEDSWFLLCKTASVGDEGEMEWLSHIGMEIVHKCEGVPLALKAIGSVLRGKELSQHEWSKVLEYLKVNRDGFPMPPLYLSYEALPSSAKPCFLYCSLLPENQMIARRDLMQMWISEGFVELHSSAGMPEDLAEAYCATIAATNFLELKSNGNETDHSCRIHDVIRDLAISLAKDDNYSGDLSQLGNTRTRVRRLSIGSRETILSPDVITSHKGLRSLLIFDNLLSDNMLRDLVDQLSYLRVLNLQGSAVQEVPSSLGMLFHLRYLNLSSTRIRHLPESIKDLKNLLFLNLHGCMDLDRIPNGITELYNLRSLDILHTNLDDMPSGIRAMKHLNNLVGFVPGNCAMEELKDLEQIRYLHVRKLDRAVRGGAQLQNKNNLRSLVLSWEQDASRAYDQYEILDMLNDLRPPANLEQLTIECYSGLEYPEWMSSPSYCPNLVGLNLKSCIFSTSLPSLGQLPKLKNLCISASKGIVTLGIEFFGNSGLPFPKLERLVIEQMDNWEEWSGPSDRKTLPVFREMHLKKCPKLRSLPHCLRFSTALTKLVVEAADSIRMIEDLHFVTELSIKDCPNLERISYLTALKTLEIVRCPLLQDVEDAEVLQHLMLEDLTLESLPKWLAANKLMNLRMLEITGNHDLLKSLQMEGPERQKIATVPYVYAYSTGNSRSISSLPVTKKNQVDSHSPLNIESPVRLHVPVSEPQRRVGSLHLTVNQIYRATKNFSVSLRLGNDIIGTVYKGVLPNGQVIAVKRVRKYKLLRDGFSDEVELLSKFHHPNLVDVLGCTAAGNEFFIIMEHVSNGDLREHLDGRQGIILDFNQRLKIALEVAQAFTYLHTYAEKAIIHQNVLSSHILLTESYVAKVSSIGLARFTKDTDRIPFTTSTRKVLFGYLDPEYLQTNQVTSKSDVFSFGILLLEIVSGRRPLELERPDDEMVTIKWAFRRYDEGYLGGILDPLLNEVVDEEVLQEMLALAFDCAAPTSADRPVMKLVRNRLLEIMDDYGRSHGR